MAVRYQDDTAVLDGPCTVEEAGDFAGWLLADRARRVDLAPCTTLHTAFLQTLMALRPPLVAVPQDPGLARWLARFLPDLVTLPPATPPRKAAKPKSPRTRRPRKDQSQ